MLPSSWEQINADFNIEPTSSDDPLEIRVGYPGRKEDMPIMNNEDWSRFVEEVKRLSSPVYEVTIRLADETDYPHSASEN